MKTQSTANRGKGRKGTGNRGTGEKSASPRATSTQTAGKQGAGNRSAGNHRIYAMSFASVYPLYVQKAERKGRTKAEVDEVIRWLTGYSAKALADQLKKQSDFETFFRDAPAMHPHAAKVSGVVCGVRIEELEDPLMRSIRRLDKLVDELAKGRPMEKILRT
jgi:hypothetical protein